MPKQTTKKYSSDGIENKIDWIKILMGKIRGKRNKFSYLINKKKSEINDPMKLFIFVCSPLNVPIGKESVVKLPSLEVDVNQLLFF